MEVVLEEGKPCKNCSQLMDIFFEIVSVIGGILLKICTLIDPTFIST